MRFRHLDYAADTPVQELGPAALDALLERGDLEAWGPLARAVRADPHGALADTVLRLCDAHPMYGTSTLWRTWIGRLRGQRAERPTAAASLAEVRQRRGLTQQQVAVRMGRSQSDVSKLERRADVRLSTLRSYVAATGARLRIAVRYDDEPDQELELAKPAGRQR